MNSFSPKGNLSNSKTAVRFAVDFIFTASLAFSVIGIGAANEAQASGPPAPVRATSTSPQPFSVSPPPKTRDNYIAEACLGGKHDSAECKAARSIFSDQTSDHGRSCDKKSDSIGTLFEKARKACSNAKLGGQRDFLRCFDQIQACNEADKDLDAYLEDATGEEANFCDTVMANKCPGLPRYLDGRNFADEEREMERERLSSKREVDQLAKERREAQQDMLKQQRELQEAQQDAAYEVRKAEREIANDMSKQFKEVKEGQQKAFEDAQRAYEAMDANYIKMRHESRQHAVKVEDAKDKFHGQCIAQAESQFKLAEKERQAAKSKKKKNAGSATRLAGSTKRNSLNQTRLRNFDYNAYLNECLNGQTGVGKSLANSVRAAEREKEANDQFLKEQASLIEQQRQSMLKKLMELEGTAETQNAEVVKLTNERLQNLSEEQQRISTKNQSRLSEFMQNQQLRLADIDQRMNTENEVLQKYSQKANIANSRALCAGDNAKKSENSLEKIGEGWSEAQPGIQRLEVECKAYADSCDPAGGRVPAGSSSHQFQKLQACTWALQALDPKRKRSVQPITVDGGRGNGIAP